MRAVIQDITIGRLDAQAVLVVSNKDSAQAISFAREAGIPTCVIPTVRDPAGADLLLYEALLASGTNLVILSGYLRKLGPMTLRAFENRILNMHPALLPAFGGSGMYGRKVHEAVLASGAQETGATIHLVDGDYDHGSIIAQERFPIPAGIEAQGLESLVMEVERSLMLDTLGRIASGGIPL